MTCAIEDAGFEIRDSVHWIYGTGFPKSLDVSKAIDKRRAEAARWTGFGTALKPAHEPIVVARKPLTGTVAANVLEHGTGAINIDACRVGTDVVGWGGGATGGNTWNEDNCGLSKEGEARPVAGRFPPNVVFTHDPACTDVACDDACAVAELARQSGVRPGMSGGGKHREDYAGGMFGAIDCEHTARNDTGTAARFFPVFRYVAKASTREREAGCEALPAVAAHEITGRVEGSAGQNNPRAGVTGGRERRNTHPTVKPVALMRWLVRLVTPPGGIVLDPFAGSGTTGVAAVLEGFDFLGVELDPAHVAIARARIAHAQRETR